MVDRVEQDASAAERRLLLAPVHARDPDRLARQQLRCEIAERRDDARPDQLDLPPGMALAGLDLVGEGIAVPRRPTFEDIADVHLCALEADPGEQLLEQLAGRADERDPLLVLVEPRRFPDEHQVGVWIARAEDDLRPALRERAA